MAELTPKEIKEKPKPIGWLYKVIVDKHLTGPLLDGQIVINGVMGTPVNHLYFTPTLPIPHIFVWWQTSVYAEAELTRAQEREAGLSQQLEFDRGAVADAVTKIKRAIDSCVWLISDRGSYEWNDDRWMSEFGRAINTISNAYGPLSRIAADWTGCPRTGAEVAQARVDLIKENAELKEQIAGLREERDLQAGVLQADAAVIEDLRAQLQPHNRGGWVIAAEKASRERNEMREQRDKLAEALKDALALLGHRQRGFDSTVTIGELKREVIARGDAALLTLEGGK